MALFHVTSRNSETLTNHQGTVVSLKQLISGFAQYFEARARLLSLETKLAVRQMKTGILLMGGAALLIVVALLLMAAALVMWLSTVLPQGNGAAASGIVAGGFILGAAVLVWRGREAFKGKNHFPVTKSELKTDKQWLKEL